MKCCRSVSLFSLLCAGLLCACGFQAGPAHSDEPVQETAPANSNSAKTEKAHKQHPANHLAGETSPYLLLHVHNPVDWYPWGPEAFTKAKAENKPIFLSIGYSSCYWCHVMERESFSDEEIAAYINEHFVAIKVDREERPDVDDIYMTALQVYYQAVGSPQGGGWPMSMFLTPDGKPMLGGTYFPPRQALGRPGFLNVLQQVQSIWTEHHDEIVGHADVLALEVRRIMQPVTSSSDRPLDRSLVTAVVDGLRKEYDAEYGGLDFDPDQPVGPKFPVPSRLMLLQSQISREMEEDPNANADNVPTPQQMVDNTLEAMRKGGIFDHLGGGFHRYSTDRRWLVPHFEKMLYDNAQLAEVYADAYRRTNKVVYRDIALRTYDFVLRKLTDANGGFYSALDAETDGVEGQFYVWSPEDVTKVLGEEDAKVFAQAYGLDQPEFFEHGYVLHLPQTLEETADALDMPAAGLRERLGTMRDKLLNVRDQRPALLRDDKVLTSWNGLMIRSLAEGGQALDHPVLIEAAEKAALFVLAELRDDQGRLLRTHRGGESKLNAYLDDYAFLVDGLLALHKVTENDEWLTAARKLTDAQLELFWDEAGGGFFFTSSDHEELLARTKNAYDSVIPSGNSVSVRNLTRLAQLTGQTSYRERAAETLTVFADQLDQRPTGLAFMALALDAYLDAFGEASKQVTAAKPPASSETQLAQAPSADPAGQEPLILAGRTNPRDKTSKVAAKAYLSVDKLPAGQTAEVAVVLTIQEGWHINPNPATLEFQIPSEMSVESEQKTTLESVDFPKGEVIEFVGERVAAYEDTVTLKGKLKVPAPAAGQNEVISLKVRYQACHDSGQCLRPTDAELTIRVPIAAAGERPTAINQRLFSKQPQAGS